MNESEIRAFIHGLRPYRTDSGPAAWGPDCARCGADEYRIDGYCSCECRDAHDYEHAIADALALMDACRRDLAEERARTSTLAEALEALSGSVDVMACASDPTVPCAEVETGFEWPDDWCFPCYVRRIVQEALECGAGTEQPA